MKKYIKKSSFLIPNNNPNPKTGNVKDNVLIITQYPLPDYKRNMNQYQRNYYGANYAKIHLLVRKKFEVSKEIKARVTLHRAPVHNRVLFFLYAIILGMFLRFKHIDVVETDATICSVIGCILKYFGNYFWVMDIWDPVRSDPRYGQRKSMIPGKPLFWLMSKADLHVLSCLPEAGCQVKLRLDRCIKLYNAIDVPKTRFNKKQFRATADTTLHLALARYRLGEKEGFDIVLKAAEKLLENEADVLIHLIGNLDENVSAQLSISPAVKLFQKHGVIKENRSEFFKSIHVGLVPYPPLWDMSYIFPIKVLEHLSQGNVVIASNLPGLATTIQHGYNGLLFKPGDSDDLANCILKLCKDRDLCQELSNNAILSVQKYDPNIKNKIIFDEIRHRRAKRFHETAVSSNGTKII